MNSEEGIYLGTYTGAQAIVLGAKKTPFITLDFDVTHKAGDGEWLECGATFQRGIRLCVSDGVWNNETAKSILLDKLKALGFNGDFASPVFGAELLLAEGGTQLKCEWDGKYNNWDFVEPLTDRETIPLDTNTARVLNARYRTAISTSAMPSTPPKMPPKKGPQGPQADAMPTGDDIPFSGASESKHPDPLA